MHYFRNTMIKELLKKTESLYDLNSWLDWLAEILTLLALFILPISFVMALPIFIAQGNYFLVFLDIILWGLCLLRAFVPRAAKYFPHVIWLVLLYIIAISFLITLGPSYARSAWMILCAVLAAIIYRVKGAIIASAFNVIILIALYFFYHPTGAAWSIAYRAGLGNWLMFITSMALISILSSIPVGFLISRFDRSLRLERKTKEALQESEVKYRTIFENAIEGIYQVTKEGRFLTANNALARMAGYESPEEFIASIQNIKTQLYVHPESRERFQIIMEENGLVEGFETEFYKKNKSIFWAVINARAVKDEQGKVLYHEGLIEDITLRKQAEEKLYQSLEILKKEINTTISVLVSALDVRDPYTSGHQSRTAHLACAIATELGLDPGRIEGLRLACSIHDIGKLAVPAEILTKPKKLTALEFSLIKEHAKKGFEILKDVESLWPLAQIVYQHHERMNGTGYPRNLKGEEILLEARILAVADVVEAMASHRPYRASLGSEAALEEIEKNKGMLYDRDVAMACLKLFREKGYELPEDKGTHSYIQNTITKK